MMAKSASKHYLDAMKIRWSHLLIPLVGGALASANASIAFWTTAKPSLLTALSVIAAGVLVRLARGLPFSNVDQFTVEEARAVAKSIKRSVRALRALIFVVFATMAVIVFADPLLGGVTKLLTFFQLISGFSTIWLDPQSIVSGLIGLMLVYVFVRVFAVIGGDVGLVDLQSKYLVTATERKQR